MTNSACTRCGVECAVGITHHQQHPVTREWIRWRHCLACAKAEDDLQDERAVAAKMESK